MANFWKSDFLKLPISLDFLYEIEKVDSATETRGSEDSEYVHDLVFHFEYIEYIVEKDLAVLVLNLDFFWGWIFKNCQIRLEKVISI